MLKVSLLGGNGEFGIDFGVTSGPESRFRCVEMDLETSLSPGQEELLVPLEIKL